ncbi:MAG: cell division protein FtsZ [Bacteroidaceae bacterium]|jgi:cell division protein FtsZ
MSDTTIKPLEGLRLEQEDNSIIKVIGVGGGGGNAVAHMYKQGIHDVNFMICNTDKQALKANEVPSKIQMGPGLGAGNVPSVAEKYALDSADEIRQALSDGTQMVFITAGMGGGTGTGAAPVIANIAKSMDILTVGIVTIPFLFEGRKKIIQALDGVDKIAEHVDALLVINNERLRDICADMDIDAAFAKADDTLTTAARSIAEIITKEGKMNVDFADVRTTLKDGGISIMSIGYGEGENRLDKAFKDALHSPLINNNDIYRAQRLLFYISYSKESPIGVDELTEVHEFMSKFEKDFNLIWGCGMEDGLGEQVKVTIIATGFGKKDRVNISPYQQMRDSEEEEKKEAEESRIQEVYGKGATSHVPRRNNIFIFAENDLANEQIISLVENTPTYLRQKQTLKTIQSLSDHRNEGRIEEENTLHGVTF